jgi:cobalt-zinc-cadmium efflux system membrane fusion protein
MKPISAILMMFLLAACSRPAPEDRPEGGAAPKPSNTVEMKKVAQAQIGLSTTPAAVETLSEYLSVTGTVQPVDANMAQVRPLARGRLQDVLVRVGDRVRKGQPLARYDNMDAGEVAAQYQGALAEVRKAEIAHASAVRQLERSRRLAELGATPRKDFEASQAEEQAARAHIELQRSVAAGLLARLQRFGVSAEPGAAPVATITAPIAGAVVGVTAAPGDVIDADRQLFAVADLSVVWVQAEVYEKDLSRIRLGQVALIQVDTYANRQFTGKVTHIADTVDPKTRTVKVRCEVPNREGLLKLDMFAAVNLPTVTQRRAVAVPDAAIQHLDGKPVVFVQRADEKFDMRAITPGISVNGFTEIVSGVAAGENVVTQGAFHLKSVLLEREIGREE